MSAVLTRSLWLAATVVLLAVPAFGTSTGDGAWEWQNPTPIGNWLESTCFVDSMNGWAAGHHGTIIHTTDGGVAWHGQTTYTKKTLSGIHFCDLSNGWAVGEGGTILHTSNGGATWHAQTSGVTEWLYGVHAESKDAAWAAGDGGVILYTQDGGRHWWKDFSGTTVGLRSIWWSDPDNGWATGQDGTILYRNPFAEMWVPQHSGVAVSLDGVCFVDKDWGWAVGEEDLLGLVILHTEDGGRNWSRQKAPGGCHLTSVSFSDRANGWAVGDWQTILWTKDGGANWQQSECPITGAYLRSVSAPGGPAVMPQAWAVGWSGMWLEDTLVQDFLPCVIIHTNDGINWTEQSFGKAMSISGIDFVDPMHGWACGSAVVVGGSIMATADGGKTWQWQYAAGAAVLEDIDFVDVDYGWACGYGIDAGVVLHTADGGQNWYDQMPPTPYWLVSICFLDRDRGWVCGENGTILHTQNGGAAWEPQTSDTTVWLMSIHFVDPDYGWCVGYSVSAPYTGIILATTDGGKHWVEQTPQGFATPMLESVYFTDRQNGWAVGGNGWILHTTDGGTTWRGEQRGADQWFSCVRFASPRCGWIVAGDYVLATANGGLCWVPQQLGCQDGMGVASFSTEEQGWVAGGGIMHTETGGFGTCIAMKALSDFRRVKVQNVVVTARLKDDMYVQQPDRSSGILVRGVGDTAVGEGDVLASLIGTTGRTLEDERCITLESLEVAAPGGEPLAPLGLPNRSVGGGDFCCEPPTPGPPPTGQRGVEFGFGLNNIGLLARTWGKVKERDQHIPPEWMIIDDDLVQPNTRVKVIIPAGLWVPDVDRYVVVTGPISCVRDLVTAALKRAIKVRKEGDIWEIN